jgi:hypothetical protein
LGEGGWEVALVSDLDSLKLTYERLRDESKRLRDARGHFARGLGPAPASAGIATAVTAALGQHHHRAWLYVALGLLVLMVFVGGFYGSKPAYRQLYARRVHKNPAFHPHQLKGIPPDQWYERMIQLELSLYGEKLAQRNRLLTPLAPVDDLQTGMDAERTGAIAVQVLWVGVVACLVVSQVA